VLCVCVCVRGVCICVCVMCVYLCVWCVCGMYVSAHVFVWFVVCLCGVCVCVLCVFRVAIGIDLLVRNSM